MAYPTFYVEESDTLPILFDSFDGGTGASITMTGIATTDMRYSRMAAPRPDPVIRAMRCLTLTALILPL